MARLTDLIVKAKSGKPVKHMFGLNDGDQTIAARLNTDALLEQVTCLEATFFEQADDIKSAHSKAIIIELEQIISDL